MRAVTGCFDDSRRCNSYVIGIRAGTCSTAERDIDRAAGRTADTERSRNGETAITATAADGLGQDAVGDIAEGEDATIRRDQDIATDNAATATIAAQRDADTDAGCAADRDRAGRGPAAITTAATDGLGKQAMRITARRRDLAIAVQRDRTGIGTDTAIATKSDIDTDTRGTARSQRAGEGEAAITTGTTDGLRDETV